MSRIIRAIRRAISRHSGAPPTPAPAPAPAPAPGREQDTNPFGFTHSGGPSTAALVNWYNQKTGETWTAPSGGYIPPSSDWSTTPPAQPAQPAQPAPPPPATVAPPTPTPTPVFGRNQMPVYNPALTNPNQVGLVGGTIQPFSGGQMDMSQAAQAQAPSAFAPSSGSASTGLINSSMQQRPTSSISISDLQDQRQRDQQYVSGVDANRQGTSQFPVFNPFYNNRN